MIDEFNAAVDLFVFCWEADIPMVGIENPVMHDLARDKMPSTLPAPHVVQPHWFGDPQYKATGWYLRNLPELQPTLQLRQPERNSAEWKKWNMVHRLPPNANRAKLRSRFFPGMAAAVAQQWGDAAVELNREGKLHNADEYQSKRIDSHE